LWDTAGQCDRRRFEDIDEDRLRPVGKIGSKPRKNRVGNSKAVLKPVEKNGMVNGVKSSGQVK